MLLLLFLSSCASAIHPQSDTRSIAERATPSQGPAAITGAYDVGLF
jgi:hypothetical protein